MTDETKPAVRQLTGGGTFADGDDGWAGFLSRLGADPRAQGALVARNFVLDEGVVAERRESYEAAGAARDHGRYGEWAKRHEDYLGRQVFLPSDDDGPPAMLDPGVPEEVPETFRLIDSGSPFLGTDPNRFLVRVEELRSIADRIGVDRADLEPLLEANLPWSKKAPEKVRDLDQVLHDWHSRLDRRPLYAGFWEDLKELFPGDDPRADADGWPDVLRDRMGLAHLDPGDPLRSDQIAIVVFRYPVKDVSRIQGTGGRRRPLVTPTVLDGTFSEAFCPSPRGSATGHVVNLDSHAGFLRREVLHPRPCFRAHHLWRLGTLTWAVDRDTLTESRAVHLLMIRDEADREDYAAGTDEDLLS